MKIKKKKNLKLVLVVLTITAIVILNIAILYKIKQTNKIEIAPNEVSTSNIGITTEEGANSWDTSKLSEVIVDTSMVDAETGKTITMYVPIPAGYTASKATSEDTVIEGLVIYEGEEEVTDSNVDEAKTTRNQYVWIPVNPEDVYWTDDDGKNWGIKYSFSEDGRNKVNYNYSKQEPVIGNIEQYMDYCLDIYENNIDSSLNLLAKVQMEFEMMIKSIKIYGGFYIGRYEVGDETAISRNGNSGITNTPVEMQGKYVYNCINWYEARNLCASLAGINENIETCLIYGTLWDNTLEFLVKSGNKIYSDIVNSTSWGNYKDSVISYKNLYGEILTKEENQTILIPTGGSEDTKSCNIYDLAGNTMEWSQEINNSAAGTRCSRGGYYSNVGTYYTASFRYGNGVYQAYDIYGCRAVLWIN